MWRPYQETGQHNGVFAAGKRYIATVRLTAASGYTFEGVDTKDFGYTGASVNTTDEPLLLTIDFPETSSVQAIPVSDKDLTYFIPKPVSGGAPLLYFSGLEYSGKVSWESVPTGGLFRAGTVYTAKVTLFARTGYTFDKGLKANFFKHTLATTVTNADNTANTASIEVEIVFPQTEGVEEKVSHLDLTDFILAPVKGGTPASSFSGTQYSGGITWKQGNAQYSGLFAGDTVYTAVLTLTAASGWTFNGLAKNAFTYTFTGTGGTVTHDDGTGTALTVTITFPKTELDAKVDDLNLAVKVYTPAEKQTPIRSFAAFQYSGTVEWTPDAWDTDDGVSFALNKDYTAKVTLTAGSGYTFTGLKEDAFQHVGANSVSFEVKSPSTGVVTITFPATIKKVTELDLAKYLPKPVSGEKAVTSISGNQYSGKVEWTEGELDNSLNGLFIGGWSYTAKFTLTANKAYTFDGLGDNPFKHSGGVVSSQTREDSTITVTVDFPITEGTRTGMRFQNILTALDDENPATNFMVSGGDQSVTPTGDAGVSGNTKSVIDGNGTEITVTGNGTLIKLHDSKQTLTLKNITFKGTNTLPLFEVSGGTLTLENVTIQGGSVGVLVNGGTLEINPGTFIGYTTTGVKVMSGGTVNMNGGTISSGGAGGVLMEGGTFNMNGGVITYNNAANGGGVSMTGGAFNMSGKAAITNNTATNGGGVYMTSGTFNMSGGTISGNNVKNGGGVYVRDSGTFTMSGGTISKNEAAINGNGSGSGGGVYVFNNASFTGTFTKSGGGTISGNTAGTGSQAYLSNGKMVRNSEAGPEVDLTTVTSDSAYDNWGK